MGVLLRGGPLSGQRWPYPTVLAARLGRMVLLDDTPAGTGRVECLYWADGRYDRTVEYVDGDTLTHHVAGAPLPDWLVLREPLPGT